MDSGTRARLNSFPQLKSEIVNVLKRNGVTEDSKFQVESCTKPGYPGGEKSQLILRVPLNVEDKVPTNKWSDARRELEALLSKKGFDNILVELLDEARAYQVDFLPVHFSNFAVRAFESCRADLLKLLEGHLTLTWVSMTVFHLLRPSGEASPAVVVLVQPNTIHDWQDLKLRFGRLLDAAASKLKVAPHLRSKVDVEFIPGEVNDSPKKKVLNEPGQREGFSKASTLTTYPKMGDSIGWKDKDWCGTLGGFFQLRVKEKIHRGFLTSYHVVADSEDVDLEADRFGTSYGDSAYSSQVWFAGRPDARQTLKEIQGLVKALTERIRSNKKLREEKRKYGMMADSLDTAIGNDEEILARWKDKENVCKHMPRPLGKVLISSGRAMGPSKETLDWAFVEIDGKCWDSIQNMNALPTEDKFCSLIARRAFEIGVDGLNYANTDPDKPIAGFGAMVKNQWYFKTGRTSNLTSGMCNGTKMDVNLAGVRTCYDSKGHPQKTVYTEYTTDWVIVNGDIDRFRKQMEFSMSGDSGSLIIDVDGNCAGLLFGSIHGHVGNTSYIHTGLVTDISSVMRSIKTKTRIIRRVQKGQDGKEVVTYVQGGPESRLELGRT